jgi:hypothetical protein
MRICQHIVTLRNKGGECDAETTWFRAYSREQWPVFYRHKLKQNSCTKTRLLWQKENYQQQPVMAGNPRLMALNILSSFLHEWNFYPIGCSQIFKVFHCFKRFITYMYVPILSCILISRREHQLEFACDVISILWIECIRQAGDKCIPILHNFITKRRKHLW